MAGMDNVVFSGTMQLVKEEFDGDGYVDNKVFINETTGNVYSTELNKCSTGDETKSDLMSTDIKSEISPSHVADLNTITVTDIKQELPSSDQNLDNTMISDNIKIENDVVGDIKVDNKQLFCNNCNEYYEEYCTKCGMLMCILNGSGVNHTVRKEIPSDVLEIKEGLFGDAGVFALKTIPKGVKFGPFTGFGTAESSWRLKGGKFVVGDDKSESINWMQYVNNARSICDQNLDAFQYEDDLYYRSTSEIQRGEELLVYFGEEYEKSLNDNIEMDFIPHIEVDAKNVFACTYCCFGFSLKVYLVEHKTVCPKGTNENFEEIVQCPLCEIYLEKKEYLEYHKIYCCKGNVKHCVLPPLDGHTSEENNHQKISNNLIKEKLSDSHFRGRELNGLTCKHQTNGKYYVGKHVKLLKEHHHNCTECEFKTNYKQHLEIHIKTKHLKEYNYSCVECKYKTNDKAAFKRHTKSKHLEDHDYNCTECEYKTSYKSKLKAHVKTKHLNEHGYNCMECEYKTNYKQNLETHVKTKHLKECDYNCVECEFKTNNKSKLRLHVKSKHLKEYDYSCDKCKYKTNNKSDFEKHTKSKHLKERNYNCMECEYKTSYKHCLQTHLKSKHLKNHDYNCTECEYKTNFKPSLEAHVKTKHLKEHDYNCEECEYKTNYKHLLKIHLEKHLK